MEDQTASSESEEEETSSEEEKYDEEEKARRIKAFQQTRIDLSKTSDAQDPYYFTQSSDDDDDSVIVIEPAFVNRGSRMFRSGKMLSIIAQNIIIDPQDVVVIRIKFSLMSITELTVRDMACIPLPGWFSDSIIDAFIRICLFDETNRDKESTCILCTYNSFAKAHKANYVSILNFFRNRRKGEEKNKIDHSPFSASCDFFKFKRVALPVNYAGNHWYTAVADLEQGKISIYDSLYNPGRSEEYNFVFNQFKELFKQCLSIYGEYKDQKQPKITKQMIEGWETAVSTTFPRQVDGSSCGAYTCRAIWCVLTGSPMVTKKTAPDAVELRKFVNDQLVLWHNQTNNS